MVHVIYDVRVQQYVYLTRRQKKCSSSQNQRPLLGEKYDISGLDILTYLHHLHLPFDCYSVFASINSWTCLLAGYFYNNNSLFSGVVHAVVWAFWTVLIYWGPNFIGEAISSVLGTLHLGKRTCSGYVAFETRIILVGVTDNCCVDTPVSCICSNSRRTDRGHRVAREGDGEEPTAPREGII